MEVLIWIVCISMLIGFSTGVITGYGLAWWSGQGTSTPEEPMCFDKSVETERSTLPETNVSGKKVFFLEYVSQKSRFIDFTN